MINAVQSSNYSPAFNGGVTITKKAEAIANKIPNLKEQIANVEKNHDGMNFILEKGYDWGARQALVVKAILDKAGKKVEGFHTQVLFSGAENYDFEVAANMAAIRALAPEKGSSIAAAKEADEALSLWA